MPVRRYNSANVCSSALQRRKRRRKKTVYACSLTKLEKIAHHAKHHATSARAADLSTAGALTLQVHLAREVEVATARTVASAIGRSVRRYALSVGKQHSARCDRRTWAMSGACR